MDQEHIRQQAGVVPGTDDATAGTIVRDYQNGSGLYSPYAHLNPSNPQNAFNPASPYYTGPVVGGADPIDYIVEIIFKIFGIPVGQPAYRTFPRWLYERLADALNFLPCVLWTKPVRGSSGPAGFWTRVMLVARAPALWILTPFKAAVYAALASIGLFFQIILPFGLRWTFRILWKILKWVLLIQISLFVLVYAFEFFGGLEWLHANISPETERLLWEKTEWMRGR